jgi:hypothetical protein
VQIAYVSIFEAIAAFPEPANEVFFSRTYFNQLPDEPGILLVSDVQ